MEDYAPIVPSLKYPTASRRDTRRQSIHGELHRSGKTVLSHHAHIRWRTNARCQLRLVGIDFEREIWLGAGHLQCIGELRTTAQMQIAYLDGVFAVGRSGPILEPRILALNSIRTQIVCL